MSTPEQSGEVSTPEQVEQTIRAVITDRSRENELAFWGSVMRLPTWHFATSAEEADKAVEGGRGPSLRLYNFGDRGRYIAIYSTDRLAAKGGGASLSMPVRDAFGAVCSMHPQVAGAVIDHVPDEREGYAAELWALPGMFAHFNSMPPIQALDPISASLSKNHHPAEYMLAYRMLAKQQGLLVALKGKTPACIPLGEGIAAVAFTDEAHTAKFREGTEGIDFAWATPQQYGEMLRGLHEKTEGKLQGGIINPGANHVVVNIEMFAKALGEGA